MFVAFDFDTLHRIEISRPRSSKVVNEIVKTRGNVGSYAARIVARK